MKTATQFSRNDDASQDTPKAKTLDLQVSIFNEDLGIEVRKAFFLAKSSGQELNLSFSQGPCMPLHNPFQLR
jgi:hypothetical protein